MVPAQPVQDFFYELLCKDLRISSWQNVTHVKAVNFVTEAMEKQYTKDFKRWFSDLYHSVSRDLCHGGGSSSDSSGGSSSSSGNGNGSSGSREKNDRLIDRAIKQLMIIAVNTKLKSIRVYKNASKLPGGVRFRGVLQVQGQMKLARQEAKAIKAKATKEKKAGKEKK